MSVKLISWHVFFLLPENQSLSTGNRSSFCSSRGYRAPKPPSSSRVSTIISCSELLTWCTLSVTKHILSGDISQYSVNYHQQFLSFSQVSWCLSTCIVSNTEPLHSRRFLTASSQSKCIFKISHKMLTESTLMSDHSYLVGVAFS